MADNFATNISGLDSPALHALAVTPSDSTALATDARSLYIGTGGNVTLVTSGGDAVAFPNVPSGSILPVRTNQVRATGTTASNIVAIW